MLTCALLVVTLLVQCIYSHLFVLSGELGSLTNVYKASLVCMMAGSDFIKTSTGKESVNATFPVALVMVRAVRDYYQVTQFYFVRCTFQYNKTQTLQVIQLDQ